ncbi:MAG TPA: hypothetical protein VFA26_12980, partial [Gemmataceae bacterium]|nr:hypothetical protein [Gemmataceae bacterium]
MKKLLAVACLSLAAAGFSAGQAHAWLFDCCCCKYKYCACAAQYNAFSPFCLSTVQGGCCCHKCFHVADTGCCPPAPCPPPCVAGGCCPGG